MSEDLWLGEMLCVVEPGQHWAVAATLPCVSWGKWRVPRYNRPRGGCCEQGSCDFVTTKSFATYGSQIQFILICPPEMSSGLYGLTGIEWLILNQFLNEFEIGSPMHHLIFRQIIELFAWLLAPWCTTGLRPRSPRTPPSWLTACTEWIKWAFATRCI